MSIWETSASETLPPWKPPGPRTISSTPIPRSVSVALAPGNGEPVVGREDHERVVGELVLVERVEHRADAVVERARAGLVGRHVAPRLGRVGQVRRRERVERVAHRGRLEVVAVGLEEADGEEERLRRARRAAARAAAGATSSRVRGVDRRRRGRSRGPPGRRETCCSPISVDRVAGVAQRVDEVVVVVVEPEAAVREAQHPVGVRRLAGQQRGAAAASRSAPRRTPGGTAGPGRRAAGCSASGPGGRTAGCSGRCRASGGRRCSASRVHCPLIRWERSTKSYLVCATPRSGSTLLCALLEGTGVAGRPKEYFERLRALGAPAPAARVLRRASTDPARARACSRRPIRARPSTATPIPRRAASAGRRPTASSGRS